MRRIKVITLCILFLGATAPVFAIDYSIFPKPKAIEHDVDFWKRIYTDVTTRQGLIHDDERLDIVYEKINLPQNASSRVRQRYVKSVKRKYEKILRNLSSGKRNNLTADEKRVLEMWSSNVSNRTLRRAVHNIRFQLGQANKFRDGLVRSGAWKPYILKILDDAGLPKEIANLPHVESSFNDKAYSKVGAAGMWQFTRSTGRRFMRIDHILDERMDSFIATKAAARLLENNYSVTGSWPLAITAYNHGAAGMRRAAAKLGTTDIVTVLRKYKSRTFGFASRNFYVAFLAANEVDDEKDKYFSNLYLESEIQRHFVTIPAYISVSTLEKALNIPRSELIQSNPALRPSVWNGQKYIPRGYELRVDPKHVDSLESLQTTIAKIASEQSFAKQKPDLYHRVRSGQTLSTIAARYGTSINEIASLNNLRNKHSIRVGQTLRLPQGGKITSATVAVAAAESHKPATVVEPTAIPEDGTYRVRRGDTLASIARRYGMEPNEIVAMNKLRNKNRIYPGQRLLLAKSEPSKLQLPTTPDPFPLTASLEAKFYKVKRGDTIESIAKKHGVGSNDILALNNIRNRNRIYAGQSLKIASAEPVDKNNIAVETAPTTVALAQDAATGTGEEQAAADESAALDSEQTAPVEETQESAESVNEESNVFVAKANELSVLGLSTNDSISNDGAIAAYPSEDSVILQENEAALVPTPVLDDSDSEILADPIDYSVLANKSIEVQAAETLGHYAEWLQLRASKLRRINGMRYGKPVVIGKRIKLDFSKVSPAEFEQQRVAYHRSLQEQFFERFQISGSDKYRVRKGDSVWKLAKRKYKIPIWLLRQYNPDLDFDKVQPGMNINFPRVEEKSDVSSNTKNSDSTPEMVVALPSTK